MKTYVYCIVVSLCAAVLFSRGISAQPIVTSDDILGLLGNSQEIEFATAGNTVVNVGSAGENQTWDLSDVVVSGETFVLDFVVPDGTPFEMEFPAANFVASLIDSSEFEGAMVYQYLDISTATMVNLGTGIIIPDPDTSFVETVDNDMAPLPLSYLSTWVATSSDTFGDPEEFAFIDIDTTVNLIDGWGTLLLPTGSYECLRIRFDTETIALTVIGGEIFSMEQYETIGYSWVSADNYILAEAESQENDTDPNFSNAAEFQRLVSSTTSIDRPGEELAARTFHLSQNYPNPFNPSTHMAFGIQSAQWVRLEVFDLNGRRVKTLVERWMPAGSYRIAWDGSSESGHAVSSGVYLYRLTAGELTQTRRMLLLR